MEQILFPGSKHSLYQYWPNIVRLGEHWNIGNEYWSNIAQYIFPNIGFQTLVEHSSNIVR